MANMAYCRFVNTYQDLLDCLENMDEERDPEEEKYKKKLVKLCKRVCDTEGDDEEE